ncbi:hypothetical protein QAD02_008472 [Eretmocerus hayati]|uniref:Uncharacterized protein n=1 Tax=Eretmocerus hayati TaxID=131215 RepID=A0ACC2NB03_9HYME|nr:hypothetical protein QAD02_008472 [Eretmocerus hayati]
MFGPRESTTHLVVIFLDYTRPDGQRAVELMPVGWWHQVAGVDFCSYPPDRDIHHVPKWVEEEKSPEDGWIAWKVKVIKQAKNHEQGLRRLKKSYTQEEFSSSTDEVAAEIPVTESDISILNDDQMLDELMDISPLFDEDNDDTRKERLPSSNSRSVSRPHTSDEPSVLPNRSPSETLAAVNRVRSNSKKRPTTVEDLDNFEKRIKSQIKSELKSFRRSTQYNMNKFLREAASRMINQPLGESMQPLMNLQNTLPFKKLDEFEKFDEEIANDVDKQNILKIWMTKIVTGHSKFTESVAKILEGLMRKAVQQEYSACGKKINGKAKKDFSNTASFRCMLDVVLAKFSSETDRTSRWFSGSGDREGGKKLRSGGRPDTSSTSGSNENSAGSVNDSNDF